MRPPLGFAMPRARWFLPGHAARKHLESVLLDPAGGLEEWFRPAGIHQLLQEHAPDRDRSTPLWLLYVLALWRSRNREVAFD
ncbi:MAG: asparagine synthase-related protein [Planctomycetota bacterium]